MSTNAISYEDYKKLLAAGQKYVAQQQAADPEWAAFLQKAAATSVENAGELGTSPTTDYWAKYMTTLSPQQALGFQQNMADSSSWTDKVGSVLKYAIPAMVGGAGLAATGALGAGLQGFVGGAPLGATGAAGAAALPAFDTGVGGLFGSQAAIDSAIGSTATGLGSTAGLGGAALTGLGGIGAPSLIEGGFGSGLLSGSAIGSAGSAAATAPSGMSKWLTDMGVPSAVTDVLGAVPSNMWLPAIGGLLAGATADKGSSTSKVDNTPGKSLLNYGQMTATAGQPMQQAQQPMMAAKYQNSGLGRFGPGLFNPAPYSPTIYGWGKP